MPTIETMFGEERDGNTAVANFFVFHVPVNPATGLFMNGYSETPIYKAAQHNLHGVRRLASSQMPAFSGMNDKLGTWTTQRLEIPEGTILKIQGKFSRFASSRTVASMFIRLRREAALRQVSMKLLRREKSRYEMATFKGNFDVLSLPQVLATGLTIHPQFQPMSHPDKIKALFIVNTIEPEVSAYVVDNLTHTTITNLAGEEVKVIQKTNARRLRLKDNTRER